MKIKNILIFVNSDWFFLLHIYPIIDSLKAEDIVIHILTKNTGKKEEILKKGFRFVNLDLDRKGFNPIIEIKTFIKIFKTYNKLKPNVVHQITIKPIIYGSIVSRFLKIRTINTICGLGFTFNKIKSIRGYLAFKGYSFALRNPLSFNFFENKDDRELFILKKIILTDVKNKVINGVGANIERFKTNIIESKKSNKIVIVLASRMIWEKGIKEFVEASKILFNEYKNIIEFRLYGKIDEGNPSAIPNLFLKSIEVENYIKWFDFKNDMVSVFRNSDVVVLPSFYREGCPMVLMEACAMGLPIITTNAVGCKECVDEGVNGFKVSPRSVSELADAMEKLIKNKELRIKMGKASRVKAERDFDQKKIIAQYQKVFNSMLNN